MKKSRRALPPALLVTAALAAPGGAVAQSGQEGYTPDIPPPVEQRDPGEELPFTGLDLGLLGAGGASLLLMGVAVRRLTRETDSV